MPKLGMIVFYNFATPYVFMNWCTFQDRNTTQVVHPYAITILTGLSRPLITTLFSVDKKNQLDVTFCILTGQLWYEPIHGRTTYQPDLTTFLQPRHMPTQGYNITQSSAPDDGHMVARNMLSNY